ncbi:NfeD family protein [Paenibacillus sp. WQ 127069]|jgi:membrane protein implicated in regulation of membrane protease activity|uniref:NfeD family protein n=1 Tax=Paenibacillus baimaensis TaxID=2982185 RepID=A0ABT2UHQ0_9BACL|nr:NfeD family protein [Paenibacillus sp. WQ 127069]MCU6794168.1 NfeD family protein [Paenibacillus sp. WQ 127069]
MELWSIWLIIGGILLVVEMLTFTFYLLWLGLGAVVAAAVAWIAPDAFVLQILAGCLTALILTFFTKPLTRRFRTSRGFKDVIDEMIGKQGIVLETIEPGKHGIVKVGNETWSASSNEQLLKDEIVIVVERGNTIIEVQKWGGIS